MLFVGTPAHGDHHNEGVQRVGAWFDAHECAICKHLGEKPELMQAMRWETHLLKNGMMMVAVAPEELRAEYAACCKSMKNASEEIADGAEAAGLDAVQTKILTDALRDFDGAERIWAFFQGAEAAEAPPLR